MPETGSMFELHDNFFVIDSESLTEIESKLYGYTMVDGNLMADTDDLGDVIPTGDGMYVYIRRDGDKVAIYQDFIGAFGLHLYRDGNYFALSNSYALLVEHVKKNHRITFNQDYANYFFVADLCSASYSETLINEIEILDRSAVVHINITSRELSVTFTDYQENTIELGSDESFETLDRWHHKWTRLWRNLYAGGCDLNTDLSGGFDSRMVFALLCNSGIDLNQVRVYSIKDDLHTHIEDYEIASAISQYYEFELNNPSVLKTQAIPYAVEDSLNISFYTKAGFHKQLMTPPCRYEPSVHSFGGSGGECIRSYWHMSAEEFVAEKIRACNDLPRKTAEAIEESIRKVLGRSFEKIRHKFSNLGRPVQESELLSLLYRETRCRNHFGRGMVELYCHGYHEYSPLLDPDLHKLKLSTRECEDNNLLMAIIFDRYATALLDFPFDGGRAIAPETIAYAKRLNAEHVFQPVEFDSTVQRKEVAVEASAPQVNLEERKKTLDEIILRNFAASQVKASFKQKLGEAAYNRAATAISKTKYHPLQNAYTVIAIANAAQDVACNELLFTETAAKRLVKQRDDSAEQTKNLREHPYLEHYITGRMDIKFNGSDNNTFEVMECSDAEVVMNKPAWMQVNGQGIMLESRAGRIQTSLRCVGDGKMTFHLRGHFVQDANGRRIPVWVDYHSLCINGRQYLSAVCPVWHDKPFAVSVEVKNGDIITVAAEWEPHDEIRHATAVEAVAFTADTLDNYTTLRVDLLNSKENQRNAIKIERMSDQQALVTRPKWMQARGDGCVVESRAGMVETSFKCLGEGVLSIAIRSRCVKDRENNNIPYRMDLSSVCVNGAERLSGVKTVWHDEPFCVYLPVKDGEIIQLGIRWKPHLG